MPVAVMLFTVVVSVISGSGDVTVATITGGGHALFALWDVCVVAGMHCTAAFYRDTKLVRQGGGNGDAAHQTASHGRVLRWPLRWRCMVVAAVTRN